jgi:peptidoglycan/LPS O-acetylase OafA/YrhL
MSQSVGKRIFGLDLLRAIAIGLVMVCHTLGYFLYPFVPRRVAVAMSYGSAGVDLFFVLSGFLVGGILLRELEADSSPRNLVRFWSRRWWRTVPNYYLFLVLNLGLYLSLGEPMPRVAPYLVFAQGAWWDPPIFFHETWSLSVEEWFYLLFAALAFSAASVLPKGRGFVAMALAIAGSSLGVRAYFVLVCGSSFNYVTGTTADRLDSLMFGVLAAHVSARWPTGWRAAARPSCLAGLAILGASIATRVALTDGSAVVRLFYFDGMALGAALLLPRLSGWRVESGRVAGFVTRVSRYSYSMYLANSWLGVLMSSPALAPRAAPAAVLLCVAWWIGTYWLSALCFHGYESRMTRLRDADLPGWLRRMAGRRALDQRGATTPPRPLSLDSRGPL